MFDFFKKEKTVTFDVVDRALIVSRVSSGNALLAMMKCTIHHDTNSITIGDISTYGKRYNEGNGSLMMEKLISYADETGIELIGGRLSCVDIDHKGRLLGFYNKFGFVFFEYEELDGLFFGEVKRECR